MFSNKYFIFIIFLIKCLFFSSIYCQEATSCFEEYTVNVYFSELVSFTEKSPNVSLLVVKVSEKVSEDLLYSIRTKDVMRLTIDPFDETNTGLQYFSYTNDDTLLHVDVEHRLNGVIDYNNPNRQETLLLHINYDFYSKFTCVVEVRHDIIDENTAWPEFVDYQDSEITVREDFPTHLQIPNFQIMTYDNDATSPNNVYSVIVNPECPIQATKPSYTCENGVSVPVSFYLTEPLNYDIMERPFSYYCSIELLDKGTPPLSSQKTIILNVSPYPDEDPVFTSDFYTGYLFESLAGSTVTIFPTIEASDLDMPPRNVYYEMTYANNVSDVEYFSIDSSGKVTLTQDLDIDILLLEMITFIITACDGDKQCSDAYLSIRLPLQSPSGQENLEFERDTYTVQVTSPTKGSTLLWVHAQFSSDQEDVMYSLIAEESSDLQYFEINEITGEITATADDIPDYTYFLKAKASSTVGNFTDTTMVNIQILRISDVVSVVPIIVLITLSENRNPLKFYTITGIGASYYCILDIQPTYFNSYFAIDNDDGTLYTTQPLDADNPTFGNLVTIKVAAYSNLTPCIPNSDEHLLINEELIKVEISDSNENLPYFVDQTGATVSYLVFFYPEDKALQGAIGPIGKVLGRDNDVNADLRYHIYLPPPNAAIAFQINAISGELYFSYNWKFNDSSTFTVSASDALYTSYVTVNVESLPINYISTLNFDNLNMSDVERKVSEVSDQIQMPLHLLYSNLVHYVGWENYSKVQAHVYSSQGYSLYNWEKLRQSMSAFGLNIEVQPFTDADLYDKQDFKTWTIVLGCITGLLVLVVVAAFTYPFWPKKLPSFNNVRNTITGSQVLRDSTRAPNLSTTRKRAPVVSQEPHISSIHLSHGTSEIAAYQEPYKSFESSENYSTNEPTVLLVSPNSSELSNSSTSNTVDTIHEAASTATLDTEVSSYDMQHRKDKPGVYPSLDDFNKEEEEIVSKPSKINSKFGHENEGFDIDSAHVFESDSDSISDIDNKTEII